MSPPLTRRVRGAGSATTVDGVEPSRELIRRARLTVRYHGGRELLRRILAKALLWEPLALRLLPRASLRGHDDAAQRWYAAHGAPVTVVIPAYGRAKRTLRTVDLVRRTTDPARTQVVVADDASPWRERVALRVGARANVLLGRRNLGFAGNVNRGLRAVPGGHDVVLLNNDVDPHVGWLERLQYAAYRRPEVGILGPKLLYPDTTIQSAGSHRYLGAPEWFDHRFRFFPPDHGPANVPMPLVGATGACLYVKRAAFDDVGLLDESYPMAFEDADWCLRAWQAGWEVRYEPNAELTHHESLTRGRTQGERELRSARRFWEKWGDFFDARDVRTEDGALRIVYVTEDTGIGGGHRVIFEHANGLAKRGHCVEIWSLGPQPTWFPLEVPVRRFATYAELTAALAPLAAIKVATWWVTARVAWRASVLRGIPAYFVQDIETSYYEEEDLMRAHVLAWYRQEFRYLTTSGWNAARLEELGVFPTVVPPGIDLDLYHPTGEPRREDVVLSVGRAHSIKNFALTRAAWQSLAEPRPQLWLFGLEPHTAPPGVRYVEAPSDEEVNSLFNQATVFVQTSRHEGFSLPMLEAMAAGTPVVCTDAHGNLDFCSNEENCLLVEDHPEAVAEAIRRLLDDPALRERLSAAGRETAARYRWEERIDALEAFYQSLEQPLAPGVLERDRPTVHS